MDQPYELLSNGKPSGLTELPVNWIADDFPYYEPQASGSLPSPDAVFEIYKGEFDGAYKEGGMSYSRCIPISPGIDLGSLC